MQSATSKKQNLIKTTIMITKKAHLPTEEGSVWGRFLHWLSQASARLCPGIPRLLPFSAGQNAAHPATSSNITVCPDLQKWHYLWLFLHLVYAFRTCHSLTLCCVSHKSIYKCFESRNRLIIYLLQMINVVPCKVEW